MRVAVLGVGYVGAVTCGCLAQLGHQVVGVDVDAGKVQLMAGGSSPVREPGLDRLIEEQVAAGRLTATTDVAAAVSASEISLVCVGTPSGEDGLLDVRQLERAVRSVGRALRDSDGMHTIVIRSTVLPGSCERLVLPLLEHESGALAGERFELACNPEFLREGSSIADFLEPTRTVIGELRSGAGDAVEELYAGLSGVVFRVGLAEAEAIKLADNAFHALKVAFANEIGSLGRAVGADGREVMRVLAADTRLNLSPAYLVPGNAFGGPCLGKDLRGATALAAEAGLDVPLLGAIARSNERQLQRVVDAALATGATRICLAGLAFKRGTDDLRESPLLELAARLAAAGIDVAAFDPGVSVDSIGGANARWAQARLPSLSRLIAATLREALEGVGALVVGADVPGLVEAVAARPALPVIDLVGLLPPGPAVAHVAW